MRTGLLLLLLVLVGCGSPAPTVEHSLDASVDTMVDAGSETSLDDAFTQSYDHSSPTVIDASGCLEDQVLYCRDSPGITIVSCGVICNVIPETIHTAIGPTCLTCASLDDILNCGWICYYPPDSGW